MTSAGAGSSHGAPAGAQLGRVLRRVRRRLMLRRALESASRILPWCAATLAVLVAAQHLLGERSPLALRADQVALVAAAALAAPLLVSAVHAALGARIGDLQAALLVDRGLGLKERLTAAVALRAEPDAGDWARLALEPLGGSDPRRALPFRPLPWRASAVTLAALVGAFLLPPIPAADAGGSVPDEKVVKAAAALEAEAAKAEEDLEERGAAEEAQRVLEEVRKAAQRAQLEPMTSDEALQELERIDQKARAEQERRQAADAGALQRALSSIEQAAVQRDSARRADEGEARSLEKQLEQLAKEFSQGTSFEERETKRMAARLRDAAEALGASHPELAAKLGELADAIENGDMEKAAQLAQELARSAEMQQLSADAATGEALDEARRMVRQAMAQLGRAPTDEELRAAREAAGQGESEGDGDGDGQSEGQGKGQGGPKPGDAPGPGRDRSGRAIVATDWGVGTTHEAGAEFQIGRGQQADRQSSETSDWREAYEALHDSTFIEGARARATRVQGRLGEGEIIAVETRQVSQAPEQATLPAIRIPPSYSRAAEDALAREEIPAAYADGVRKYFTSLDTPAAAPAPPPAPPAPPAPPKETP